MGSQSSWRPVGQASRAVLGAIAMPVQTAESEYAPDMDKPVMRIGAVAELLGVSVRMVRIYEERGLVQPARKNNQRLYSFNDVCWLGRIRELVNEEGYDLGDIARLISLPACWQLKNCPEEQRAECPVVRSPGKRCWEIARRAGRFDACRMCQLYRMACRERSGL
jgi:MerR family transcriptional regulator/heat shock protein HspR